MMKDRPLTMDSTYDLLYYLFMMHSHRPIISWKHLFNLLHGLPSPHHQVETYIKYLAWITSPPHQVEASVYKYTHRFSPGILNYDDTIVKL